MSFADGQETGQAIPGSSATINNRQEPKFTLALVLETLSDLCSKSDENAAKRDNLVAELRETCPYWKKDDVRESRKLIDEYLEQGRQQNLCTSLPNETWRFGFKRPVYKIQSGIPQGSKIPGSPEVVRTTTQTAPEIKSSVTTVKKEIVVETEKCHRCGKMCEAEILETRKFCYDLQCLMDILKSIKDKKEKDSKEKKEIELPHISLPTLVKTEKVAEKVVTIKMCVECGRKAEKEAEVMRQEYTMEQLLEMLAKMHKRYFDEKLKKRREKKKRKRRKNKNSGKSASKKSKKSQKSNKSRKSASQKSGGKRKSQSRKSQKSARVSAAGPMSSEPARVDNLSLPTPLTTNIDELGGEQRKGMMIGQQKVVPESMDKKVGSKKSRKKKKKRKGSNKKNSK